MGRSSEGWNSNAVAKLALVTAVSGMGLSSAASMGLSVISWSALCAVPKGLTTSRATLMTVSNLAASSADGSRYRKTLSS
ncbi:hypothetical protein HYQ46_007890 [Verticillium longisporum]|nr:hypothetical protein HYQ46_007890 [Verticillium longisporum]